MKYLKLFENHITEEVGKICNEFGIQNWSLNSDGTIDVSESVDLRDKELIALPLKFRRIEDNFICSVNHLTSLEGCPSYVGDMFSCRNNNLTSLENCPKYVGGDFNCSFNNIKNFEGIGYIGDFYCWENPIESFWVLFDDASKIEMFNEWEIIQGDNVYLYRLNDFLETIGKDEVKGDQLKRIKLHYNIL